MPRSSSAPRRRSWLGLLLLGVLCVLLWLLPASVGLLHESDQAAMVSGALEIVHFKQPLVGLNAYIYDKLYLSHWLLALSLWIVEFWKSNVDPVAVSSWVSSGLLSVGLGVMFFRVRHRLLPLAAIASVLLSPNFICHAPHFACAFVSAGFLLLLQAVITRVRDRNRIRIGLLALALTFLAVGTRADAVLVLPALVWAELWPAARPWRLLRSGLLWSMVLGAVLALACGKWVATMDFASTSPPSYNLRLISVYTVFGLGSAVLLLAWLLGRIGIQARHSRTWPRRAFWLIGAFLLLVPFLFYVLQMFTPRYWTAGSLALLAICLSRRGNALWRTARGGLHVHWIRPLLWATTLVPLVVGVRLPDLKHPHLTFLKPTVFPTADGNMPMGATAIYSLGPRFGRNPIPDHNQGIWLTCKETHFKADSLGRVPVLQTAMWEIVKLAVRVQGHHPLDYRHDQARGIEVYADLRSLTKMIIQPGAQSLMNVGDRLMAESEVELLPGGAAGYPMTLVRPKTGRLPEHPAWRAMQDLFGGVAFSFPSPEETIGPGGDFSLPTGEGREIILLARESFSLECGPAGQTRTATLAEVTGWYQLILSGQDTNFGPWRLSGWPRLPKGLNLGIAALPDYMNAKSF